MDKFSLLYFSRLERIEYEEPFLLCHSLLPSGDHFWLIFLSTRTALYRNLKIITPPNSRSPNLAQLKACLHTTVDFFFSVHDKIMQKLKCHLEIFLAVYHNNFKSLEADYLKGGLYFVYSSIKNWKFKRTDWVLTPESLSSTVLTGGLSSCLCPALDPITRSG